MEIFKHVRTYLALFGILIAILFSKWNEPVLKDPLIAQKPTFSPYHYFIAGTGLVEALDKNINVGSPVDGIVDTIYFKVGDTVHEGDPLFKLDDSELMAQKVVQEAEEAVQEASLNKLTNRYERIKNIGDPRAINQDELKNLENDVIVQQAKVKSAQAALLQTKMLLNRLTVKAPQDGVILQQDVRKGESISKANPVIIIGDLSLLQLRAQIDEQNASRFKENSSAVAYPKNNTEMKIPLKFLRVEPFVIPKQQLTNSSAERVDTRVLQVLYTFEAPKEGRVYVGQQMDVYIEADH